MKLRKTIKNSLKLTILLSCFAIAQQPSVSINDKSKLMFELKTDKTYSYQVTLAGSDNYYLRKTFQAGQPIEFDLTELPSDGLFKTEIITQPNISKETLNLIRNGDKPALSQMVKTDNFQVSFRLENSQIFDRQSKEDDGVQTKDQQILDDLIVSGGSLCVGFDCVNGESFGFDTIRIKENNVRLHFDDSSGTGSFPFNDWRLIANDSTNGGSEYFAIEDSTAGRIPFRVEAGAIANALYVDTDGDVGIGTSTPVVELHAVDGNTPTLRLEQNGSNGFTAYTFDIAANETNFFIRDVNTGRLPFKIRPGASESNLDINNGKIGINRASPNQDIHIVDNGDDVLIAYDNSAVDWVAGNYQSGNSFVIAESVGGTTPDLTTAEFSLDASGNLTIAGLLVQNSNVHAKHQITELSPTQVLEKLNAMPIHQWQYKAMEGNHIGPMAQDFHSTFQLGQDESKIATLDVAGVALVAIQGLSQELTKRNDQINSLEQKITQLEAANLKQQKLLTDIGSYEARLAKMEQLFKNQKIQMVSNSIQLDEDDDLEVNQNTLD
jgi:hypothetical protein